MMGRVRSANRVWLARTARTRRDRAYLLYLVPMVALVMVAPIVRAIWIGMANVTGLEMLTAPEAPRAVTLITSVLWASALLVGTGRGPALRPPFVTWAMGSSGVSRSVTFSRPMIRASAIVTTLTVAAAGLPSGVLVAHGVIDVFSGVMFVVAGFLVGVITSVAWLAGQALKGLPLPLAFGIATLGALAATFPGIQRLTPWGWVGLTYPVHGAPTTIAPLVVLAAMLVAAVPALLGRISLEDAVSQAIRWESAVRHTAGLELAEAATVYRATPMVGRRLRAVRPSIHLSLTFFIRDAVGALRTPVRLVAGVVGMAAAGALISLIVSSGNGQWLLGAAVGLLVFVAMGPLTDGIRHATSVGSDLPLYGISDGHLLVQHALFPAICVVTVLLTAAVLHSSLFGGAVVPSALSTLCVGTLALGARVSNALKGPLPSALLAPIPTPMGDYGGMARLTWALDGVLLMGLAGAAIALPQATPVLLVATATTLTALVVARWRARR